VILDQQGRSLVKAFWAKTNEIIEILFLTSTVLAVTHFIAYLAAVICILRNIVSVPGWFWIELKVLTYPLILFLWLHLLFIWSSYELRPSQQKHYGEVAVISFITLLLAINFGAMYSMFAFPLICCLYAAQNVLDKGLSKRRGKQPSVLAADSRSTRQTRRNSHARQTLRACSQQETVEHFPQAPQNLTDLSPDVTIWYSPAEEKVASRLRTHLWPKMREGAIRLWDASQVMPGALKDEERARAIQSARVAVMLISSDFMAYDFMVQRELPKILYRAQMKGTVVLCLHVSPCNFQGYGLEKFYPLNQADKPYTRMNRADREQLLAYTTHIICLRLGIINS
jgi:hypothetical protein